MSWLSSGLGVIGGALSGLTSQQQTQTQTTNVSPFTQGQMNGIWGAAQQAAAGGPGANLNSAGGYATGAQNAGQTGLNALSGDQSAVNALMNPYISNVIDANNAQWNNINAGTATASNEAATGANAFGGSRAAVAQGAALSQNNIAQAGQNASLLSQGYQGAMNQAAQLAGYGLQGAGLNTQLGGMGVGNGLWNLNALKGGYVGPSGQTTTGTSSQQPSVLGGIGQLAGAIAPFFMM